MGVVFDAAKNSGLIRRYDDKSVDYTEALIEPGREKTTVTVAPITEEEARAIALKADALAIESNNPIIARIVAMAMQSIILAVRMAKTEAKQTFQGMLGSGAALDMCWLRPRHVGGTILNPLAAGSKGVHGQTILTTYAWIYTHTAGTATDIIPEQKMAEEAAVVHLGAIDPIEVPKIESAQFYIAAIPSPAQSCDFRLSRQFGAPGDLTVVQWEKPVIIGPEKTQRIRVYPYASGDDKMQLLSLLIAKAEDLSF